MARGLEAAGFAIVPRHPDVQTPGKRDSVRVRLDADGNVVNVDVMSAEVVSASWTFANGNHNRFPFVQLKGPVFVPEGYEDRWKKMTTAQRDGVLRRVVERWKSIVPADRFTTLWEALEHGFLADDWPGSGLLGSLKERRKRLVGLDNGPSGSILRLIDRALTAFATPERLFRGLAAKLLTEATEDPDRWLDVAGQMLLTGGGALYFDASRDDFDCDASDPRHIPAISRALSSIGGREGRCALTGETTSLLDGNFPKPTLPVVGGVYIFSKNGDIPAAGRYGRSDTASLSVGQDVVQRLGGALDLLAGSNWRGRTWTPVPSERPGENDLLIAFARSAPDAPCADLLAGDEDGEESPDSGEVFLLKAKRVIEAIDARRDGDRSVEVCLLRRVDPGNHKAVFHRNVTADALCDAAARWQRAQDNLPPWLALPVPSKARRTAMGRPPFLGPLRVPAASRIAYAEGGRRRAEVGGMTAAEAFTLFLDEGGSNRVARKGLHLLLRRQSGLLAGSIHALRRDAPASKLKHALDFDRSAALRAGALAGLLLSKIGRDKEDYMSEAAFKLGQLLAVADIVHVGYCADVRKGEVPPTLLGNSVLTMAQSSPRKALALLARRWSPYWAWAKRVDMEKARREQNWAILRGAAHAARAAELSRDLHGQVPERTDDAFRAELLLGYVAGLPKRADDNQDDEKGENI
ncbi:MAG TPA: hypothetical protein VK196_01705 [Magnetospirillum sp.]|nr:hypothetical protein [Magnetospirillum sp.]